MNNAQHIPGAVILGGSFSSVAVARNLSEHGVKVCVLGSATSAARFSRSVSHFAEWPRELKENELPDYLIGIAKRLRIRGWVLFPSSDEHVRIIAQYSGLLGEHFVLTTPPWETIRFLYDKRLTYKLAQEVGVAFPHSYVLGSTDRFTVLDVEFPVVLKPAVTSRLMKTTNRKAYRADNQRELESLYETMARIIGPTHVIVQDFLPEPSKNLFSFAGYFREGEPIAGLSAKRTRQLPTDFGRTSTFVEAVEVPELRGLASQLLRAIGYTGLAEVEFMWNEEHARFELLEVNPRFWAWHGLAIDSGLDLPYMAFAEATGQNSTFGSMLRCIKWVRFLTDVRAAAHEIRSGRLSIRQYLSSLRGPTTFAVYSPLDPMPSILEPFLSLMDHLIRRADKESQLGSNT